MALTSPSAERNKVPIGDILSKYFTIDPKAKSQTCTVLEIASGYGSHMMYNSERFSHMNWIVTEKDTKCINSLKSHLESADPPRTNVFGPFLFDVSDESSNWPAEIKDREGNIDFMISVNLLHITEWKNVQALFSVASKVLKGNSRGKLFTYGPFASNGVLTPQSNVEFDNYLKMSNPDWGVRDISELEKEASREGDMVLIDVHDMPANNKILVWSTTP